MGVTLKYEDIKQYIENIGYILLSEEYIDAHKKLKMKCDIGHDFELSWNSIKNGRRCTECAGNKKKNSDVFKKDVYDLVGEEYSVLTEYKNINTKIRMKHNVCGNEYDVYPNNFLRGRRCGKCVRPHYNTDTNSYKQRVFEIVGNEYMVLGEYIGANKKILMKHEKCGHQWNITPHNFIDSHRRCPRCKESEGERRIRVFFSQNNIVFYQQYKFKDCRYKRSLPFDFAVFDKDNNLLFLIEYDGEQHFSPWYALYGKRAEESFEKTKINDEIKNQYCKNNNITLLRIPYWDLNNIEEILVKNLKAEGLNAKRI
jgi:mRNA-degrading endonuclease HigB of HigAB toxin-antitoxin module